MSSKKTGNTGQRYSDICGASNRNGEPCKLPAGWGTPGSGGDRCKLHGGASTGPKDTGYLENNDFAEGNPGGRPPEGNTNAAVHHGFASWQKAYERFEGETREFVDRMIADMRKRVKAPDVSKERRERLLKEKATLSVLYRRASCDIVPNAEDSRGFMVEDTTEIDGESHTTQKVNPALEATLQHSARQREIANELSLWPQD